MALQPREPEDNRVISGKVGDEEEEQLLMVPNTEWEFHKRVDPSGELAVGQKQRPPRWQGNYR
jgi:hypothetical protein